MADEEEVVEERNFQEGDSEIDAEEARLAVIQNKEMEEAKDELADLKDSDGEDLIPGLNKDAQRPAEEGEEQAESQLIDTAVGQKRPREEDDNAELNQLDRRQLKRQKKIIIANYYRGAFYGKGSAAILYELSKQLNKVSREILWWRIIGLTDQVLHQKIDMEDEDGENMSCMKEVQLLVPDRLPGQNYVVDESHDEDGTKNLFALNLMTQNREIGHIRAEPELKLMLLRHWTLFESIQNSNYMVAKMGLAKEPGQKELSKFLISIGVPIEQAKQKYAYMNPDVKNKVRENIMSVADQFGLNEIIMNSYSRQFNG